MDHDVEHLKLSNLDLMMKLLIVSCRLIFQAQINADTIMVCVFNLNFVLPSNCFQSFSFFKNVSVFSFLVVRVRVGIRVRVRVLGLGLGIGIRIGQGMLKGEVSLYH